MGFLTGQRYEIRFEDISPARGYALPTIVFSFQRLSRAKDGEEEKDNLIMNIGVTVSVGNSTNSDLTIVGHAKCRTVQDTWKTKDEGSHLIFDLTLDHYTLSQIEKLKKSGDLNVNFHIRFQAFVVGKPFHGNFSDLQDGSIFLDEQIAKSKWIEDILSKIGYKSVALVELPLLEYRKLNKAIDLLNYAWKSYSIGDINDVLVKCRQVIHGISKQVRKAGFETEIEQKDRQGKPYMQKYPDWKEFFNSDSKGDVVKNIIQKMSGFVAPGAHEPDILSVNHAYFALLQTFSLTHLVVSRFKMLDDDDVDA